jgi:hypothetical protein
MLVQASGHYYHSKSRQNNRPVCRHSKSGQSGFRMLTVLYPLMPLPLLHYIFIVVEYIQINIGKDNIAFGKCFIDSHCLGLSQWETNT